MMNSGGITCARRRWRMPCQFTVEELKEILLRSELDGDGVTNDAFFAELEKEDAELWR